MAGGTCQNGSEDLPKWQWGPVRMAGLPKWQDLSNKCSAGVLSAGCGYGHEEWRGRGRHEVLATAALLALVPISGAAQEVVEIDDQISCPACVIEVGSPVTLAPPLDHVYFTSLPPPLVARDRDGNFIATRISGDALVAVFGADGRYNSSYGRYGEGPDEFASLPTAIAVGEDDVLYVIDLQHLHTLAPQAARRLGQKVRLPVLTNAAVVLRSGIAVQAPLRTEAGITTVQILQPDGTTQASVGVAETEDK